MSRSVHCTDSPSAATYFPSPSPPTSSNPLLIFSPSIPNYYYFILLVCSVTAATIQATVGIRVLNKTSEEYWFLMNFNLSYLDGNVDLPYVKKENAYFLVHLQIVSR